MPWSDESVDVEPDALLPIEPVDPLGLLVPDADPLGLLEPLLIDPDPVPLVPAPLLVAPLEGALALGELDDVLLPVPLPTEPPLVELLVEPLPTEPLLLVEPLPTEPLVDEPLPIEPPLLVEPLPMELPLPEPGDAAGLPAAFASRLQASKSA